jgi:hypothetical protein
LVEPKSGAEVRAFLLYNIKSRIFLV